MVKKVFMEKKNLELKKRIMLGLVCSTMCSRDMDVDSDRQKKIRSLEMWIWRRIEKIFISFIRVKHS